MSFTTKTTHNPVTGTYGQGVQEWFLQSENWLVPVGVSSCRVRIWGAGKGSSNGGAGGGFTMKVINNLTAGQTIVVTLGVDGVSSATGTSGSSSFGSYCSVSGAHYQAPGQGYGGDINYTGGRVSSGTYAGGCASMFGNGGGNYTSFDVNFGGAGFAASTLSSCGDGIFGQSENGQAINFPNSYMYERTNSIDYIGTGGAGRFGVNGGGAVNSYILGSFPGGGSRDNGNGGRALVIVEW